MTCVFRHPGSWLAIAFATSFGCAGTGGAPAERGTVAAITSPYIGQQGRLLLGFKDPDVRMFSFPTVSGVQVDSSGQLSGGGGSGVAFTGVPVIATGSTTVVMRIAEVIAPIAPEVQWQYVLEQHDPISGAWTPACDAPIPIVPPSTPPVTPTRAIAMPGAWSPDGLYTVDPSLVTFACKTGVVAKCDGWGYPVTADPPDVTENGLATTASGADMMQACTRMARADYCATGLPNTLDGTPILIDDIFTKVPPASGYAFEAAWPGRAVTDRRVVRQPVVCLSKLRWSTLPLGGSCPLQLPDPRVDAKARFCEDIAPITMEQQGALVYSSSTYIDAGLYTYTDPGSELRLTTANLLPQEAGTLPKWQISPPPGVNFPATGQPVRFEATIFPSPLPVNIPDAGLIKLVSYRCNGDLVTSTTPPSDPSCTEIAVEGYVYPPNAPARAPLRRWFNPGTKHSNTTATAPSTMLADGWLLEEVVGGVLRAAIDVNVRWSELSGFSYTLDVQTRTGEWIPSCIDATHIGSVPSYTYRGVCVGASNRTVNPADIVAFRVNYTGNGTSYSATQPYDGVASDAYVALPGAKTTALAVRWNDVGPDIVYALDVLSNGAWIRCADPSALANDTSYVHTLRCTSANANVKIASITEIQVCSLKRDGDKLGCSAVKYDGTSPQVSVELDKASL